MFDRFARAVSKWAGSKWAFALAFASIVVWGVCGPHFDYSEGWQIVINTGTTIVTFLMVFLIQNSQNRDGHAIQMKLDELVRAVAEARNDLIGIEEKTEEEVARLSAQA